jgi:tetratricopeptide (TPR) repeat protein
MSPETNGKLDAEAPPKPVASQLSSPPLLELAIAAYRVKRFDDAGRLCLMLLADAPDAIEAVYLLALVQSDRGFSREALGCCDRLLAIEADHAEALLLRGNLLRNLGAVEDALASLDRSISIRADLPEAHHARGLTLHALNRFDEAAQSFGKALAIRPDYAEAYYGRGNSRFAMRLFAEALVDYSCTLKIQPDHLGALNNRGVILTRMYLREKAIGEFDKAQALKNDHHEVINNRGVALLELFRIDEALACFDAAIAVRPDFVEAINNRGNALLFLHRFDEALACYDRAIAIQPDYEEAHFNEARCRLTMGDMERGFKKLALGFRPGRIAYVTREFDVPLWLGEQELAGKTIFLYAQQGLGDTIQYSRYCRCLAERGAKVVLEVQPELVRLLSRMKSADVVLAQGDRLPRIEFHCALHHLPVAFSTTLDTVPLMRPLLDAPADLVDAWRSRLGPKRRPRVGLVWSGNPSQQNDVNRSLPLDQMLPLLRLPFDFVCLHKEMRERDLPTFAAEASNVRFFGPELTDFLDTAALASHLDLVVSADSSVAHLSASLGLPTWILVSFVADWRWMADRTDNPWYPTARLFRQARLGAWDEVIADVVAKLSATNFQPPPKMIQ